MATRRMKIVSPLESMCLIDGPPPAKALCLIVCHFNHPLRYFMMIHIMIYKANPPTHPMWESITIMTMAVMMVMNILRSVC